jgi:hypothetical protein
MEGRRPRGQRCHRPREKKEGVLVRATAKQNVAGKLVGPHASSKPRRHAKQQQAAGTGATQSGRGDRRPETEREEPIISQRRAPRERWTSVRAPAWTQAVTAPTNRWTVQLWDLRLGQSCHERRASSSLAADSCCVSEKRMTVRFRRPSKMLVALQTPASAPVRRRTPPAHPESFAPAAAPPSTPAAATLAAWRGDAGEGHDGEPVGRAGDWRWPMARHGGEVGCGLWAPPEFSRLKQGSRG